MSPTITRLSKEARLVAAPWGVLMLFALLPLLKSEAATQHPVPVWANLIAALAYIAIVGFPLGVALIAGMCLGAEFQYGTLALLLSQPQERSRIWRDKMAVLFTATFSAGALYLYFGRRSLFNDPVQGVLLIVMLTGVICSAVFWTLQARSTIGAAALNLAVQFSFGFVFLWIADDTVITGLNGAAARQVMIVLAAIGACYSGVMLWLGKRRFERFQPSAATGGNLLAAERRWIPAALSGALRCRPSGSVSNLIRKELRLQASAWMLTVPLAVSWVVAHALLASFGSGWSAKLEYFQLGVGIATSGLTMLIAVLAGSVPMGEEAALGTHDMMTTQPVSARVRWLVKFGTATFTTFTCALLIPWAFTEAVAKIRGADSPITGEQWVMASTVMLAAAVSFACAGALRHTVGAALAVFPVTWLMTIACMSGQVAGQFLLHGVWHARITMMDRMIADFQMDPWSSGRPSAVAFWPVAEWLVATSLGWRMFRRRQESPRRNLGSLAGWFVATALLAGLTTGLAGADFYGLSGEYLNRSWQPLWEANDAVATAVSSRLGEVDQRHPLQLASEELRGVSPLTARWLRGSTIVITPMIPGGRPLKAVIQFPNGLACQTGTVVPGQPWVFYPMCLRGTR